MAAESCEFTLKGDTVATAFFANQCRREMTQFRGLAGSIKPGAEPKTVSIIAEGERKKLESWPGNLPDARVLYASATGASEVNNLAYAVRLGLWGPETAFANREAFITQIRQGGIAAMELVAVRRGGAIERSDDMSSG